ncbi:hypothetical protein B0O80DRAFT_524050 [Mortierella sp. GBAus27b]|nr:hypothetical protein B0O80DRAFT_524050 [Mortierella sp. GBAus27b]
MTTIARVYQPYQPALQILRLKAMHVSGLQEVITLHVMEDDNVQRQRAQAIRGIKTRILPLNKETGQKRQKRAPFPRPTPIQEPARLNEALKHLRDNEDTLCQRIRGSEVTRSPPEMERDDDDRTAIDDLKVLEGQYVFDDENGDGDNNGEAVDDDDVESIEDLANEVVELIEESEPGFHPLIRALYHVVRGTPFKKPMTRIHCTRPRINKIVDVVKKFKDFCSENDAGFSIARDGIADLTPGSDFGRTLPSEFLSAISLMDLPDIDINSRWPTLTARFCARQLR